MKNFILLALSIIFCVSCYTSEDQKNLQQECERLASEKQRLQNQVDYLNTQVQALTIQKGSLETGKEIKYVVKFKIKQGTLTINPLEHAKNEINSIEIEIPVSKDYYNRLSVGQDITNSFKYGSLIVNGDFSVLHFKVVGKRMEL